MQSMPFRSAPMKLSTCFILFSAFFSVYSNVATAQPRMVLGFEEPLVSTGSINASEDSDLKLAIDQFKALSNGSGDFADRVQPWSNFLQKHPSSPWATSIQLNLGIGYYHSGYYSRALTAWKNAWEAGKFSTDIRAKALVDRAVGELAKMHARIGHIDELESLFNEVGPRPISGPATELITGAHEGLWQMKYNPGVAFLCGSKR